jgi:thiamine-phosphate pyrophosphorylase
MPFGFPCPLYPIVDDSDATKSPVLLAEQILGCGVPLLQLRLKTASTRDFVEVARELRRRCSRAGARLIINDRCDIAKLVDADGVHLGQDDLLPADARAILGSGAIIGFSTHNQLQLTHAVRGEACDYVAFGPVFATASKHNPDPTTGIPELREAVATCPRPVVAIGGIGRENLAEVLACGAAAAAVIGAIARAPDPAAATMDLLARARHAPPVA